MLIKWNTVTEKGFVARCLILLINFSFFKLFDLVFENVDLLLEIEAVLVFQVGHLIRGRTLLSSLCLLIEITFEV